MQIITGIGESEHVTSMQHRAIFEMVIGDDSYILNKGELLEPELQSNNALKIRSGMLAHHGCISEVAPNTYDEVAISNGSQGMKRIDLVVARYTQNAETKVERTEWTVIQGQPVESNPVAPDFIHGNMQDGDLTDDCPVFEVRLDGIQVVEIKKLLNVLDGSLAELNRNLPQGIPLSAEQSGVLALESARIKIIYGTYPLNAFINHQESGGYAKEIDISKYGLKEPIWATVSPRYPNGHPHVFIGVANANKLILLSDANVSGGYAQWMVIGNYS